MHSMSAMAALLPGLRELRAPLAAGYVWLLDLWLLFGTHIPSSDEATGVVARIYELDGVVADLGGGVALSFVAYLVGSLSQWGTMSLLDPFLRTAAHFKDSRAVQEARAELIDQDRSFADYDRHKGEAEFRLAILPPLLVLIILAATELDWRWGFLVIAVAALGAQGYYLLRQAYLILAKATPRREPQSPSS